MKAEPKYSNAAKHRLYFRTVNIGFIGVKYLNIFPKFVYSYIFLYSG